MSRPNPEQFARVLLWHLCRARAEIAILRGEVAAFRHRLGHPPPAGAEEESQQMIQEMALKLYQDACKEVGLPEAPPSERDGNGSH
jgi:hypothetical protein